MDGSSGQQPGAEKRLLLAIVLSFLVIFLWQALFVPPPAPRDQAEQQPGGEKEVKEQVPPAEPPQEKAPAKVKPEEEPRKPPPVHEEPEEEHALVNEFLELELTNHGAGITRVTLRDYYKTAEGQRSADEEDLFVLVDRTGGGGVPPAPPAGSLLLTAEGAPDLERRTWSIVEKDAGQIAFETAVGETTIRKIVTLPPGKRHAEIRVTMAGPPIPYGLCTPFGICPEQGKESEDLLVCHVGFVAENGQVHATEYGVRGQTIDPTPETRRVAWGAVSRTFFAAILRALPAGDGGVDPGFVAAGRVEIRPDPAAVATGLREEATKRAVRPEDLDPKTIKETTEKAERTARVVLTTTQRQAVDDSFQLYLGPKDPKAFAAYEPAGYGQTITLGYFLAPDFLVKIFLQTLKILQSIVIDYGVAIVLLTLLVKLLLHPLNRKNQKSMQRYQQKMQAVQPELNRVKERYKNNRRKMHEEMQKVMREHGVNPQQMLGGCLLMFLQLPVWVALISVFRYAIEIRQAPAFFGLITDLALPDRTAHLGMRVLFFDLEYLNALPVLYVCLTIVQQKLMPKPKDDQARSQQRMMGFMMVFIGLIFYNFASGLLIYFLTSSFLGIIEQQIIRRELAAEKEGDAVTPEPKPLPAKPKPKPKQKQRQKRSRKRR